MSTNPNALSSSSGGTNGPWQFNVSSYGALGNGKMITDANMSNGTAVLTSASAGFTTADVGKYIIVNQGASNSATNPLCTQILSWQSSTQVTLTAACTSAVTNAPAIYGTDDTAAINNCITAASNWAQSHNYKAQIIFGPQFYMLGANPFQSTAPYQYNTQIVLPVGPARGQKLCLDFIGVGDASEPDWFAATTPNLQGTCLVSTQFVTSINGTFGAQSVMGGPSANTGLIGQFANTLININGLTIVCPFNAAQLGYDFRNIAQANVEFASYLGFAPVNFQAVAGIGGPSYFGGGAPLIVTNGISAGLYMPVTGNNDNCNVQSFCSEGAYDGVVFAEHTNCQRLFVGYSNTAITASGSTLNNEHGIVINYASIEECTTALASLNNIPIVIDMMDCEVISLWHVNDSGGLLQGKVNLYTEGAAVLVNGAQNLEITNIATGRAVQTTSAYTLGTAFQNPWWKSAYISVSGGTVTGITIGPTSATATTSVATGSPASFYLPSGWWFNIAGTVKPTTFNAFIT